MKKEDIITLTTREKRQHFGYLSLLFIVAATILIWVVFRNSNVFAASAIPLEKDYMRQESEFNLKQKEAVPLYDTLVTRIVALQTMQSSAIAETDIKNGINSLNNLNEGMLSKDPRFKSFSQMALFLQLYFEDMLVLKKKGENIQRFKDQLSQCEIGFKDQQTLMNQIRAAQAGGNK